MIRSNVYYMSGLKQKENEIGLIELDEEDKAAKTDEGQSAADQKKSAKKRNTVWMTIASVFAGSLLLILLGTQLCHVPLTAVCFVIVIEAVIATALKDAKLWVHIGVMVFEVIIGIPLGQFLFLVLAAAFYFWMLVASKLFELEHF